MGHISARSVHNRGCLECLHNGHKKRHYATYGDHLVKLAARERAKKWRLDNPEKYKQKQRQWRKNNAAKAKASTQEWNRLHPERAKASREARNTRRRTRKVVNGGHCSPSDIIALRARSKGRCAGCGKTRKLLEIDHIIPVSRGGCSNYSNLQLLCTHCNRTKHARDPIEWAQDNGRLL